MAYVSQEMKAKLAPAIKAIFKKYGVKASIGVLHHSTLVVNIKSSKIDFIGNFNKVAGAKYNGSLEFMPRTDSMQVNEFYVGESYSGKAKSFLVELVAAMKGPDYFDDSDSQVDYFHTSHYININVGQWNKPYQLEA